MTICSSAGGTVDLCTGLCRGQQTLPSTKIDGSGPRRLDLINSRLCLQLWSAFLFYHSHLAPHTEVLEHVQHMPCSSAYTPMLHEAQAAPGAQGQYATYGIDFLLVVTLPDNCTMQSVMLVRLVWKLMKQV